MTDLEKRMLAVLRNVVATAQPVPAPLGPPMTEHIDVYTPAIEEAWMLVKELDGKDT